MTSRSVIRLLQVCVFLSGGVALILEAVYQKYLATLIGATTPAATVVLATYFLGLTLGAMVCPKKARRANVRLALLELFIALWSLVLSLFFYRSYESLAHLLAASSNSAALLALGRWGIAAIWILPPTMAMGAHLPTLGAYLEERGLATGKLLTGLYALNAAGACFFTLLAPFVLFYHLGLEGTLLASAVLGFFVAGLLFFGLRVPADAEARPGPAACAGLLAPAGPAPAWPFVLAGVSGFVFFALEVLWNHLIASVLGASTYSFSMLLGVVLLALFLGGRMVERAAPTSPEQVRQFLRTNLSSLVLGLPLMTIFWPFAGRALAAFGTIFHLESFWAGELVKLGVAYLLIKPVATVAATIFPLTFHGFAIGHSPTGRQLGWVNALNALGCVAGALVGGFVMVPLLGAERSFKVLWVLVFGVWAVLVLQRNHEQGLPRKQLGMALVGVALAVLPGAWNRLELTGGYGVYFAANIPPGSELKYFHEDQHTGLTTVVDQPEANGFLGTKTTRYLYTNGKFDADDHAQMPAQCAFALLPALVTSRHDRAAIVGLGSGQTASVAWAFGYHDVDVCELSAGNIEAARTYFPHINHDLLKRPEVHIIFEDGRNWLLRTDRTYDIISVELTAVWFAGAANLYSTEFYQAAKKRLAREGVLVQWIQLHHLTPTEIATVLATLADQFKDVEMWLGGEQAVILAADHPLQIDPAAWERYRSAPELQLEREVVKALVGGDTLQDLERTQLLNDAQLREVVRRTPHVINTDRNKWIEFHTPRYYLSKRDHAMENYRYLKAIADEMGPPSAVTGDAP
jgi:spermidine synthase